jgi:predicted permease
MSTLWQDIRYGVRMLAKNPGFTVVVILIIGLGVGANTAIFNALDQVSMRPLPVRRPDELVSVQYQWRTTEGQTGCDGIFNYPVYEAYRDRSNVFSGLIGFSYQDMRIQINDVVRKITGQGVTGNYFSVLGLKPAVGRLFVAEQEVDTVAHPVVVISDRFWHRQFEGKSDVVGKQVVINNQSLTIIGVTAPEFHGTVIGRDVDVYVPVGTLASMWDMDVYAPNYTWLSLLGRLMPGISKEQAQSSLRVLSQHLKVSVIETVHETVLILDGSRGWVSWEAKAFHRPLTLFMVAAVFILVIMATNITNVQLSRAATRQKEIAIRQALGAGRWRVIRQLLMESLLLAMTGGVCGIVLALWLDRIVCVLMSRIGSVCMIPGLNLRVLVFALAISLATGLLFGLTPALQMVRRNVTPALKESAIVVDTYFRRWNLHHLLVVFQVAIAVVVLVCAGLFVRSVIILDSINPGYDTGKLIAVSLEGWNFDRPDLRRFFEDLHERMRGLPGIEALCLSNLVPLGEAGAMRGVTHINGVEIPESEQSSWWYGVVSPEYFKTLNMPLIAGRIFSDQDNLNAPKVMVINEIMARKYWPERDPLGEYVTFRGRDKDLIVKVIAVVKASKMRSLIEGERPIAYWPLAQDTSITPALLIRTRRNPQPFIPIIRKEVALLGLNEVCHISTVADRVAELLYPQHATTAILNVFGLVGLLLCIIGIYGVLDYAVRQRTREIGIRMALGAETRHVALSILGKGAWLTIIGLGFGIGISLIVLLVLANQLIRLKGWDKFFLYGVRLWDPLTLIAVPFLVLIVALLACYLPARRAAKIDPMEALRYE